MSDMDKLADVVVATVRAAVAPMTERVAVLEARAPVPGPAGERGERGERGEAGTPGPAGEKGDPGLVDPEQLDGLQKRLSTLGSSVEWLVVKANADDTHTGEFRKRLDALEHTHLSDADLTKSADDLLRKEFAPFIEAAPKRTQKRVIRDPQGRVDRVVEESIA